MEEEIPVLVSIPTLVLEEEPVRVPVLKEILEELSNIMNAKFHDISKKVEKMVSQEKPSWKEVAKKVCFDADKPLVITFGERGPDKYDILQDLRK